MVKHKRLTESLSVDETVCFTSFDVGKGTIFFLTKVEVAVGSAVVELPGAQWVAEVVKCKAAANPLSDCCLLGCWSHEADDDTTGNTSRSDAGSRRFPKRQLSVDRWRWDLKTGAAADEVRCRRGELKGHLF